MTEDSDNGRDERGRFKKGNRGGPGGSRRRACEFRRAAEEAVTTEHVQALIRKATRMGLEGDLTAMRFVLERVSGRPAEAPTETEPLNVDLPPLRTAADCNEAIESLIAGICGGVVDREAAKLLLGAIQARMKAIEVTELEARLAQLERSTAELDPRTPSRLVGEKAR